MEFLDTKIEEDGAYGTVDVQISPIGDFKGSTADGKPIPEHLTEENLSRLADSLNSNNEEILVDVDHKSTKIGNEKDTKAAGWLSRFIVDPIKGLFAKLKLTRHGRDLVDSREYRHLSPVFALDSNGEPIDLHSVGMTNTPALQMSPILNSKPNEEIIEMNITKEDLIQLIKDTVASMNEVPTEDVKEDVSETTEVENSCGKEDDKEVKNEEVEEVKEVEEKSETTETAEAPKEEVKEEIKEEVKNEEAPAEEEKKEEVIKLQALNSAPEVGIGDSVTSSCGWETKHGKAFFDELKKMGYRV